jgi:diacylglycerol O-acyltransferase
MAGTRHAVRPVDDVWLAMDQPDNLMVVEGLMVIDGDLDRETYVRLLQEHVVDRFPRFRQRPRHAWLPWPGQWWEDDPSFDLDRHVREVRLPAPGDDSALEDHVASCLSRALDRQHPLWEVHLVRGYAGGTAIYTRLHHALADGTALFRVVLSLADEELTTGPARDRPGLLDLPRSAMRALPATGRLLQTPVVAGRLLLARRPASPLSVPPHHGKRAVWAPSIDVADLRGLRRATGTTVTDIVMSALAGALRRWLLDHGADPILDDLPTMVPVDLRGSAALGADDLGNQFALVLLDLPVGLDSPLGRLNETAARMRAIKDSPEAWLTYGLLEGMGLMHPRLRVHATDFFARKATGVTTSVRGPDQPLHLAGLPITRMWAWAPMSADQSLSTSIVGYAGRIHVGFKVDTSAVPDPQVLVAGMQAELAQLIALAPPG